MAANPKEIAAQGIDIQMGNPKPKDAEIGYPGSIQFNSDGDYTIEWKDEHDKKGTFWNGQPTKIHQGLNDIQLALSAGNHHKLKYTLVDSRASGGGGTVKVGS